MLPTGRLVIGVLSQGESAGVLEFITNLLSLDVSTVSLALMYYNLSGKIISKQLDYCSYHCTYCLKMSYYT